MPAIKGAEATLSEAVKEGSEMATLYYAVAAQTSLGLKGERIVIRSFIKGEDLRKLIGCEDDLCACFDHLEEGFSCKEVISLTL